MALSARHFKASLLQAISGVSWALPFPQVCLKPLLNTSDLPTEKPSQASSPVRVASFSLQSTCSVGKKIKKITDFSTEAIGIARPKSGVR